MGRITEHSDEQVAMMNQPKIDRHVDLPTMHMNGGVYDVVINGAGIASNYRSQCRTGQADETEGDCRKGFEQYPAP